MKPKAQEIAQEIRTYVDLVKREYLPRFFKTGKGHSRKKSGRSL